jgi:NAD-dependent DNA ligase
MSLKGSEFVISGKLSMKRSDFQELIESNGGKVNSSVTKKTNFLITDESDYQEGSTKINKAKDMGINIVNENFIHDSVKNKKMEDPSNYVFDKVKDDKDKKVNEEKVNEKKRKKEEEVEEKPSKKIKKTIFLDCIFVISGTLSMARKKFQGKIKKLKERNNRKEWWKNRNLSNKQNHSFDNNRDRI